MPTRVLYQVPLATWPYRLIMGAACLSVINAICVWVLPRMFQRARALFAVSRARATVGVAAAAFLVAVGLAMLSLLIALAINPQAYVTDKGIAKESLFRKAPESFAWAEISRVYCRSENAGAISSIVIVAADGRRIELGNTGGVDFVSMYELFENQLGAGIVQSWGGVP